MNRLIASMIAALLGVGAPAMAGENYSASSMWGTDGSGVAVNGALKSAAAHAQNGTVAAQSNAAEEGLLVATGSGGSITVQSIGSQTVVSNSITGDDNVLDVHAEQDSDNTGNVSNHGEVNQ